jgi:hypothetical protein
VGGLFPQQGLVRVSRVSREASFPRETRQAAIKSKEDTMPYEIQSKLREDRSVVKDLPSNWRVEFINTSPDLDRALHISVQFVGQGVNKDYGQRLVDAMLEALNKADAQ